MCTVHSAAGKGTTHKCNESRLICSFERRVDIASVVMSYDANVVYDCMFGGFERYLGAIKSCNILFLFINNYHYAFEHL